LFTALSPDDRHCRLLLPGIVHRHEDQAYSRVLAANQSARRRTGAVFRRPGHRGHVVSFFDFDHTDIVPTFILDNYQEIFSSETTVRLYLSSLKFAAIVWAITLVVGFTLANYLVFHVRSLLIKIACSCCALYRSGHRRSSA